MNALFANGYAERVTKKDSAEEGKLWYLTHHGVYHPKKPDKIRVVLNCSLQFQGRSLNDELMQGPDLTNHLIGVLMRFRKGDVPFMADIESMFYQVRVPKEHRSFLRFFWWEENLDNMQEFQMCVHLFGGRSSPSCANFALKKTASDFGEKYGEMARKAVERDFYVDDLLKSVDHSDEAVKLIEKVRSMCEEGGFKLTKFVSNDLKVLNSIPESCKAPDMKLIDMSDKVSVIERALGVTWVIKNDTIGFRIALQDKPCTKRGLLSTVSSIYDPLGLVGPFLLEGKKILQEVTRGSAGWDEPISEEHKARY